MLASTVGSDTDSDALLSLCREEDIDDRYIRRAAGAELGRYHVTVDGSGERAFAYERSASPFRDALPATRRCRIPVRSTRCASRDRRRRAPRRRPAHAARICGTGPEGGEDGRLRSEPSIGVVGRRRRRSRVDRTDRADRRRAHRVGRGRPCALAGGEHRRDRRAFRAMGSREVVVTDGPGPCIVSHQDAEAAIRRGQRARGDRHDGRRGRVRRGIHRGSATRRHSRGQRDRRARVGGDGRGSSGRARAAAGRSLMRGGRVSVSRWTSTGCPR